MEDSELKKLAVSQYQLRKYHNYISDKLGTSGASDDSEKESIVNLFLYETEGGSFTYDSSVEYQYDGSMTVKREYTDTDDSTDYAIFKVLDVDLYLVFIITDDGETYTYSVSYTMEELPDEMAELFEVGSYAVVHRISATKSDTFYPKRVSAFVESDGTPVYGFIRYVDDGTGLVGSEGTYFIILSLDKAKVYVYRYSDSREWYRYNTGYKEGNGTVAVQAIFKDLRALVCCSGIYDADTNYPDGTIGAAIKGAGKISSIKDTAGNEYAPDENKVVTIPSEADRNSQYTTAEANRDSEYQSAEANRDTKFNQEIASLESQYVMQVATSYPETNIPTDNTYYQLGSIESLTIGKITDDDGNPIITKGVIIEFDVPSDCSSFNLIWSNSLYWANSKDASDTIADGYPNIKAGYRYQILVSYLNASLTLFGQFNANNS